MSWDDKWRWSGDPEESRDVDVDHVIEMIEAARKEERERFAKLVEYMSDGISKGVSTEDALNLLARCIRSGE